LIRINYEYNPYFAVGISKIDPLPHQLEVVYGYLLARPTIRFLIADDPGAGKTIMAGLLIKELKYRKLISRILIVAPGHLIDNWMVEMKSKFSENFTFVNRQYLNNFWSQNIWKKEKQILTSIDFLKKEDISDKLKNEKWDLIIVDEAHKMSARLEGNKIEKTQRYKLGEILSRNCTHFLFLTATPHSGDMNKFSLFLSLLEPEMFGLSKNFQVESQLQDLSNEENSILIRRIKEEMVDFNGNDLFPKRYPSTIKFELSPKEKELYQRVSQYVKVNYNMALNQKRKTVAFALIMLQRRLSSSIRAIKKSLIRRKKRLESVRESDFVKNYGVNELIEIEKKYRNILDSEDLDDLSEKERWEIEKRLETLTMAQNIEELKYEITLLEELIDLAENIENSGEETKLQNLWKTLKEEIRDKHEKLIIFTEFRDTLEYLRENISEWGFQVVVIHGKMSMDERIRAEHQFRQEKQILIATEAAGEGINLQFCWLMVNYDIPWNPNRLEQRMGRIHRYLQTHDCYIYNCIAENTMEGRVFIRILEKLTVIRRALGSDRVFDVIGEIFSDVGLHHLIKIALNSPNGWDDVLERIEQKDEILIERARQLISSGSLAQKHLDLSTLNEEIRKSDEYRLWPEYIQEYTELALHSFGGDISTTGIHTLPNKILDLWDYDLEIQYGPLLERYKNITFDKTTWKSDSQKEYVAPGHPLIESLIEASIRNFSKHLTKGALFLDPDNKFTGLIWFYQVKITDGRNVIISEKIISIKQSFEGKIQEISPLIIWDYIPINNFNDFENTTIISEIKNLRKDENKIKNCVEKILRTDYFQNLQLKRNNNFDIKKKAIERSMNLRISESLEKIYQYKEKIEKGENYDLPLSNEERNKEKLILEKKQKLEQIRREKEITMNRPQILGMIMVIPKKKLKSGEDITPSYEDGVDKNKVDEAAMEVVLKFEKESGRVPKDVHLTSCGYDVLSRNLITGKIRHIEVKGHTESGDVFITPNEWFMAGRFGDDFWLYVVDYALNNPKIFTIQNPAENLEYDKILETKRYIIKENSWKKAIE